MEEIRKMSTEEINAKIEEVSAELFNLRFQIPTGQLEKPSRIKELRKYVARMKTELSNRKEVK